MKYRPKLPAIHVVCIQLMKLGVYKDIIPTVVDTQLQCLVSCVDLYFFCYA